MFFQLMFLKFWDFCMGGIAHMAKYRIYQYEIGAFTFLIFFTSRIYITVKLYIKSTFLSYKVLRKTSPEISLISN